jgi:amino acid transporter
MQQLSLHQALGLCLPTRVGGGTRGVVRAGGRRRPVLPTRPGREVLALVPILLFAYVAFEAPNAAGEEMHVPQRDVPTALGRPATVAACCYLLPVLALLTVVPAQKVTGIGGFMEGAHLVFGACDGAAGPLLTLTVFALLTQGSAW